jgi:hypothetical protein
VTPSVWEVGWKLWVVHLDLVDTLMEAASMTDLVRQRRRPVGVTQTFGADAVVGAEPGYDFLNSPSWKHNCYTRRPLWSPDTETWTRQSRRMPYY